MEQTQITYNQLYLYIAIAGLIIGALLGLIPLILGRRNNKARLGLYGFLASAVLGLASPIISLIVAGIFTWLVLKKPSSATVNGDRPGSSEPS